MGRGGVRRVGCAWGWGDELKDGCLTDPDGLQGLGYDMDHK